MELWNESYSWHGCLPWVARSDLKRSLSTELLDRITVGGNLLNEPRLSACLTIARTQLFDPKSQSRLISTKDIASEAWCCVARHIAPIVAWWTGGWSSQTSVFRVLNKFFRLHLNEATLNMRTFTLASDDIVFSRFILAARRFISSDIGDISSFDPKTRDDIAQARAKCIADLERHEARQRAKEAKNGKSS